MDTETEKPHAEKGAPAWGAWLFIATFVVLLVFFWWLLIYSGGAEIHHG